jgi:phosphoenolpyruvate synthase/pyruvate phosphate dikinase
MASILWLHDPACADVSLTGGKAANLSRLGAEARIPPGFCLTAAPQAPSGVAGDLLRLPDALASAVAAAYAQLALLCGVDDPPVAVRSSAVDEDGAVASFAGQHDTFLNITGPDAVIDAIARCWASGHADHARQYRERHGLHERPVRVAVLVQQLVPADVSGVVFSANPVNGRRDELVINASWGLGESVVAGSVTPDAYVVRRTDRHVTHRTIGDKARMTVRTTAGTREVDVPRLLRRQPALTDPQITDVIDVVLRLELKMQVPVDVEVAWHGQHLYVLQCRPITTLGAAPL